MKTISNLLGIFVLFFSHALLAKNTDQVAFVCWVAFPLQNQIKEIDILFNAKEQQGVLAFNDDRAQKAELQVNGDSLTMQIKLDKNLPIK
jgi:hypothetical protein